jgi:acyl carrier protein
MDSGARGGIDSLGSAAVRARRGPVLDFREPPTATARSGRNAMDQQAILDKIKEVVADKLDADPSDVVEGASFVDDLGADSLDVVELIMGLEDEFDIEISDEEAEGIQTVGDAIRFIEARQ